MIGAGLVASNRQSSVIRDDLLDAATRKLQDAADGKLSPAAFKAVAKDFESLFVSQMLEHMLSGDSVGESMFGSEESDEIYRGMMVEQYSKAIVKSGGIGIADYIERSLAQRALLTAQEV